MAVRAFYFGCNLEPGHFFWLPGMRKAKDSDVGPYPGTRAYIEDPTPIVPWGYGVERLVGSYDKQGRAYLHHLDNWTALAFCDRSIDARTGSKSVFVFDKTLNFDAALTKARELFPSVFARFTFDIEPFVWEE